MAKKDGYLEEISVFSGKLKCCDDSLLIRHIETRKTAGGIILASDEKRAKLVTKGYVLAVGEGRYFDDGSQKKMDVIPGDIVLFSGAAGLELTSEFYRELGLRDIGDDLGKIYLIRERDVVCRIIDAELKERLLSGDFTG